MNRDFAGSKGKSWRGRARKGVWSESSRVSWTGWLGVSYAGQSLRVFPYQQWEVCGGICGKSGYILKRAHFGCFQKRARDENSGARILNQKHDSQFFKTAIVSDYRDGGRGGETWPDTERIRKGTLMGFLFFICAARNGNQDLLYTRQLCPAPDGIFDAVNAASKG